MITKRVSAKICRVRHNYGYALIPKLVSYFRRESDGTPMHFVHWSHSTIRDYERTDKNVLRKLWLALSTELLRLKRTGCIGAADVDRICGAFEKEFPRVGLASKPEAKSDQTAREDLFAKYKFLAGVRKGA